jgi:energy-coupling factor transport system substrate-specific component
LFGFSNFFYGFLGYKIWAHMGLASSQEDLSIDSWKKVFNFILVAVLSSIACSMIIAWGLDLVKLLPFAAIGPIISVNNLIACLVLHPLNALALRATKPMGPRLVCHNGRA